MRTPTISTAFYTPGPLPSDPNQLVRALNDELRCIAAAISALAAGNLEELHAAPLKPRTGRTVLADGTDWDPGSGAGVYSYYGGAWHKLG